ncbi:MAG: PhoH family protein, partial [Victivallales bacterium]|nr:PhoH family protein [Victivallales bacterium]
MIKTYVLDTNVLLHNPHSIKSFEDNRVILPMVVIEELDKFKSSNNELGRNAREVIRMLDQLRGKGSLGDGVPLGNEKNGKASGILQIITGKGIISEAELDMGVPDNRVLRVAWSLRKMGEDIRFVSKDINVRIKADALGLNVMDFENEKVKVDSLFSGCREIDIPGKDVNAFYSEGFIELPNENLIPNEFVLIRDDVNPKHTALGRASGETTLKQLSPHSEKVWNISARSKEQRMALELLLDPSTELVTLVGQAGTGKTLLALAAALESVLHAKKYQKVLVSRPIVPMGKDIGYLPGDKDEKLFNWMQPIFDNL